MSFIVVTFYKFVELIDFREFKPLLWQKCQELAIKGTILLAKEGINGTISGSGENIDKVLFFLRQDVRFQDLEIKQSYSDTHPFGRLKVKLKREIVTLGLPEINPTRQVGTYVTAQQWNQLIEDPEIIVIDTRNQYEIDIGTFKNAINPQTNSFKEFPDYVRENLDPEEHKKIAMFCTGGIRCEKASSYLLSQGFKQVYHLQGGILKYLEEIPQTDSLWQGECFVFDERVTLKQGLDLGSYDLCFACGHPINAEDKLSSDYQEKISCPYCIQKI